MSREIDQKVVEMQFDNKNFEKNVQTSIGTIDRLKNALNFSKSTESLEVLKRATASFSMAPMEKAVETVKAKFSAFEVMGVTALANITNSAVNTGKQLVKSLTVDQIKSGWQKYEAMTSSVQTIMAATGKDIDYVSERLDKLNWFTDETSYNLTDMTNNIGKFTSAGVDLDKAVVAMQGIALEAALSGQNAEKASHAMYNFAQALGAGAVKLLDWKSIENANMSTKEFKETIIQTGKELGRLDKKGNILKITADKYGGPDKVDAINFANTLAAGWVDSDVLIKSLEKYGKFATKLKDAMDKTNLDVTSDMLRYIDKYKKGTLDIDVASKNAGVSSKEFTKILKELSSSEYDLGLRAFKAGQEAKTLSEAIDSVKDAVSTKWMTTFEIIFGNYEEAKVWWTDLANAMWDVFAASGDVRNAILTEWKELGGRDDLLESFWNVWEAVESIVVPIKEAFRDIFPQTTGKQLAEITKNLKEFTSRLVISEETSEKLKTTFKGLFAIFDIIKMALEALFNAFKPLFSKGGSLLSSFGDGLLSTTDSIGSYIIAFDEFVKKNDFFVQLIEIAKKKITEFRDKISKSASFFIDKLKELKDWLSKIKDMIPKVNVKSFEESLGKVSKKIEDLNIKGKVTISFLDKIKAFIDKVKEAFNKFVTFAKPYFDKIVSFLTRVSDKLKEFAKSIDFNDVLNAFEGGIFSGVLIELIKFLKSLRKHVDNLEDFKDSILGILGSVKETLEVWQKDIKAGTILKIAEAIGILALSLLVLSKVSPEQLGTALHAITILFGELALVYAAIQESSSKSTKKFSGEGMFSTLIGLAASLLLVSKAVEILGSVNVKTLLKGVWAAVVLLNSLTASLILITSLGESGFKGAGIILSLATSLIIISGAVKILGNMDLKSVGVGVIATIKLLQALTNSLIRITFLGESGFKGASIILSLAVSLKRIAKCVKMLGEIEFGTLAKGVIAVIILLKAMTESLIKISKLSKSDDKVALVLLSLAASLMIISKAVETLGGLSLVSLIAGVGSIIALLAALTLVLNELATNPKTEAVSGVILSLAASIMIIALAIKLLGSMDIKAVLIGIGALAAIFAVFIGAVILATPILPLLLLLGGALALFGSACLMVGAGVWTLATGMGILAVTGVAGAAALSGALLILSDLLPTLAERFALGIVSMTNTLAEHIPTFVNLGVKLLLGLLQGVADNTFEFVNVAVDIITNFINGIANNLPKIIDSGWKLAIGFIDGIADGFENNAEDLNDALKRMFKAMWEAFKNFFGIHSPSKKFEEGGWQLIAGLVKGLGSKIKDVVSKMLEIGKKGIHALHDKVKELPEIGRQVITGFINGINEKIHKIVDKGKEIGGKILGSIKDKLGIESPSKEAAALGEMVPLGLVKGASKFGNKLRQVGENIGSDVLDSLSDSMSNIIDIFDYADGFEPVITPVLDDSNVRYGFEKIESMFNNGNVVSLRAVTSLSNSMENKKSDNSSSSQKGSIINNFTQNNYSPKSLSNAEIYRNTKTLFAKEKGDVKTA